MSCESALSVANLVEYKWDVGRINDNTVVTVFKVRPRKDGRYHSSVVNIFVLGRTKNTKQFKRQVIDMKRIIKAFQPKEVVIDTNGLTR